MASARFTVAYWCVFIAAMLPYTCAWLAKWPGWGRPRREGGFDNRDPRGWLARQSHPRVQRGNAAHLNAFEAFAPFAAAVLMAQAGGVATGTITWLAVAFVVLRVLHGACYLADAPLPRSLAWLGGIACVVALMVLAVLAAAEAGR
jgi:uncharacterized MAPEG superfamily protein